MEAVPVAILILSQAFQSQWNRGAAGTVLTLIPIVTGAPIFSPFLVTGLSPGATGQPLEL